MRTYFFSLTAQVAFFLFLSGMNTNRVNAKPSITLRSHKLCHQGQTETSSVTCVPMSKRTAPSAQMDKPNQSGDEQIPKSVNTYSTCSCSRVVCNKGQAASCSVRCASPKRAYCQCRAYCRGSSPVGRNSCRCIY